MQPDSVPGTQEPQTQNIGAPAPAETNQPFSITGLPEKPKVSPIVQNTLETPPVISAPTQAISSPDSIPQQFVGTQEPQTQNVGRDEIISNPVPAEPINVSQPYPGLETTVALPSAPEAEIQPMQDVVTGLDPAVSEIAQPKPIHEPKTAQELKDLENFNTGNADLTTNSGTPLDEVTEQQSQATTGTQLTSESMPTTGDPARDKMMQELAHNLGPEVASIEEVISNGEKGLSELNPNSTLVDDYRAGFKDAVAYSLSHKN